MSYNKPPGKSVKEYLLKPVKPLELGSTPVFIENPLAPKGQEISIEWRKDSGPSYYQQFNEGGTSSEKLFRCGLYWRKVTFFDEEMNRKRFVYGYTNPNHKTPEKNEDEAAFDAYRVAEFLERHGYIFVNVETLPEQLTFADIAARAKAAELSEEDSPEPARTLTPEQLEVERERDKQRRQRKQKQSLKNIVNKNYLNHMYTFTFALELNDNVAGLRFILPEEQQRSREAVEKVWNKQRTMISRKLKESGVELRFVKVLEKHDGEHTDERKRGTFHIHLATDRPIDKSLLQELWGYGVVWVDDFNKSKVKTDDGKTVNVERDGCVISPGDYMSKYLDKDFAEADELGKRAYSPSKNLVRVKPDRDEERNEQTLQKPSTGFSDFDKTNIDAIEPGLFAKIEALKSAYDVKVFHKLFPIEFTKLNKQTGEAETVKMFVQYEDFNFRLLMKNAKPRKE